MGKKDLDCDIIEQLQDKCNRLWIDANNYYKNWQEEKSRAEGFKFTIIVGSIAYILTMLYILFY